MPVAPSAVGRRGVRFRPPCGWVRTDHGGSHRAGGPYSPGAMLSPMEAKRGSHHAQLAASGPTILCGSAPPGPDTFHSQRLQALYANNSESWSDVGVHSHSESDEVFIVLEGSIVLDVDGAEVTLSAGEFAGFPAGLRHAVVRSNPPTRHLVMRAPSVQDKTYD